MPFAPPTTLSALKLCLIGVTAVTFGAGCGGRVRLLEPVEEPEADVGISDVNDARSLSDAIVFDAKVDATQLDTSAEQDAGPRRDAITTRDAVFAEDSSPVATACPRLADAYCGDATKACCDKHGDAYSKTRCTAATNNWCKSMFASVTAGNATYDASRLEACAESWERSLKACDVWWLDYVKQGSDCAQLFKGKKTPGSSCADYSECAAPEGAIASCEGTTPQCRVYRVVDEDQPCSYVGTEVRYCDRGLFCDFAYVTPK